MEQEVETVMVLSKRLKLRTVTSHIMTAHMNVFECENPYVIIILIESDQGHSLRVDIHKEDLAFELRAWLEGKSIRNPAVMLPLRVEDSVTRFVKFGKTPLQEDLIMWILSRCEFYAGDQPELVFGGKETETLQNHDEENNPIDNEFNRTAMAAIKGESMRDQDYRLAGATGKGNTLEFNMTDSKGRSKSNFGRNRTMNRSADMGMYDMSRQLLGKSETLEMVKQHQKTIKGREGAKQALKTGTWSAEHTRLVQEVEVARKRVEQSMDERRRMIEIAKARQLQKAEKYRTIRSDLDEAAGAGKFVSTATHELLRLQRIEAEIEDDIRRQKNRAHRASQNVRWTMAPPGFQNRRGKSQVGPVLGPGPLPPNAVSALKDPRMERTLKRYYWDSAGRRHMRDGTEEDEEEESLVEKAMEAIRRAAANISAYKLDLRAVFDEFDTSGDGFLSPPEMAQAFLNMGVQLDIESMDAIFKHFDPNGSGTVHYGEFVWAFFNRRGLVRQWKRKTDGLTETQIRSKFHLADINGDGRLNPKEFKKLLKSFGIELSAQDVEVLVERFDMDGDGDIDLYEFQRFVESEQRNLADGTAMPASAMLPTPKTAVGTSTGTASSRGVRGASSAAQEQPGRPSTAHGTSRSVTIVEPSDEEDAAGNDTSANGATHPAGVAAGKKHGGGPRPASATARTTAGSHRVSEEDDTVDALWLSRMLQAQAEVEARLGRRYYS